MIFDVYGCKIVHSMMLVVGVNRDKRVSGAVSTKRDQMNFLAVMDVE